MGELFTNVGPLLIGLGNAGVEILFDLLVSFPRTKKTSITIRYVNDTRGGGGYIVFAGLACLFCGEGKSLPPAFQRSNDEVAEFFIIGRGVKGV
jgi:hypothetical protein